MMFVLSGHSGPCSQRPHSRTRDKRVVIWRSTSVTYQACLKTTAIMTIATWWQQQQKRQSSRTVDRRLTASGRVRWVDMSPNPSLKSRIGSVKMMETIKLKEYLIWNEDYLGEQNPAFSKQTGLLPDGKAVSWIWLGAGLFLSSFVCQGIASMCKRSSVAMAETSIPGLSILLHCIYRSNQGQLLPRNIIRSPYCLVPWVPPSQQLWFGTPCLPKWDPCPKLLSV